MVYTKKYLQTHLDHLNGRLENAGLDLRLIYGHRAGYSAVDYRYSERGFNTLVCNEPPSVLADKATIFVLDKIVEAQATQIAQLKADLAEAKEDADLYRERCNCYAADY